MGKIGSHDVIVSSFAILALAVNKFPEIQALNCDGGFCQTTYDNKEMDCVCLGLGCVRGDLGYNKEEVPSHTWRVLQLGEDKTNNSCPNRKCLN